MKRVKYKYTPKYPNGGNLTPLALGVGAANIGGNMIQNGAYNSNGSINSNQYAWGSALSDAGQGAALGASFGSIIPGIGTAVGTGIGALGGLAYGLITGNKKAAAQNDQIALQKSQMEQRQKEIDGQNARYAAVQQDNYNKAYYTANPVNGYANTSIYKDGGEIKYSNGGNIHIKPSHKGRFTEYKKRTGKTTEEALHSSNPHVRQMANFARNAAKWHHEDGGTLNPIASDTVKAEGATHAQGGITLESNGKPYAEVEDQEIIKNNHVYSDTLKLGDKTYAEIAENLGRKKGKFEKLSSSNNYRDKNTVERSISNIDNKLANLFNIQEASKSPVMNTSKDGLVYAKYGDILPSMNEDIEGTENAFLNTLNRKSQYSSDGTENNGLNTAINIGKGLIPFADNIYNNSIIGQTPQVPLPNTRVALQYKAMPMKTTVNVGNQLSDTNDYYKNFNANIDQNTSSSNVGRGNKLAAFANVLRDRNTIYTNKQNTETGLINQNNQNIQNVDNMNTQNQQNVSNENYALLDNYNLRNADRTNSILGNKSQNFAMATNDAQRLIQDSNMKNTDESRIMTDALKYNDGAGFARLVGSKTMTSLVSDPTYYKQVENSLKNSGQTKALDNFYKTYGRR